MLLFNCVLIMLCVILRLFKNISCYCLTAVAEGIIYDMFRFKNISCYCLTAQGKTFALGFQIFKNISCYCLTDYTEFLRYPTYRFKNISCYCLTNGKSRFFLSDAFLFRVFPLFSQFLPAIYEKMSFWQKPRILRPFL